LCRSVHAEQNAIISASRDRMIGATLYLACIDSKTGELVGDVMCCMMCKRTVINAGIETVVIKTGENDYKTVKVRDWILDDDSLSGVFGY
ncbi:MAG: cytidine deaminase, partial [Clostridia bacterium]|nr:cytidine deaminase [Clostridia bacterium]